jgi:cysteine desulfuration protein SufE
MPGPLSSTPAIRARLLIEQLAILPDNHARLTHIVERAWRTPSLPESLRRDEFKVAGCISDLWLVPAYDGTHLNFHTDATAAIPKGVACFLCEVYSGGTPREILDLGDGFIRDTGLPQILSVNRSNGLAHLVARILRQAQAAAPSP